MRSGRLWSAVNRPGDERELLLDDHHLAGTHLVLYCFGSGWGGDGDLCFPFVLWT